MTEESVQDGSAPAAPHRRRVPKQDPLLAADVATARAGVEQIAQPHQIGPGHRVVAEEDRLVVHLFECTLPGYRGWHWFASLARAPRSRTVTVCEVGLLPGEDALLAPEWVPWAERVSPEEKAREAEAAGDDESEEPSPGDAAAGEDAGRGDAGHAAEGGTDGPSEETAFPAPGTPGNAEQDPAGDGGRS